jgi:hypothetical protein
MNAPCKTLITSPIAVISKRVAWAVLSGLKQHKEKQQ